MPVITAINAKIGWQRDGDVEVQLTDCGSWSLDLTGETQEYRSCTTNGAKKRLLSGTDASGDLGFFTNTDDPIWDHMREGDFGTLKLFLTDTLFWEVPAFIEGLSSEADIDAGAIIETSVSFTGNGPVLDPSGNPPPSV